jgi:uncharacterized membrane protein required for colicin V production
MFNVIDLMICFLIVFYAFSGWRKGFFRSILGPVSFVICFLFAWLYFKRTHNILISFTISMIGPFLINQFVLWVMSIERDSQEDRSPIDLTSRWLGCAVTLLWGLTMSLLVLFLLAISPLKIEPIVFARQNIVKSFVFSILSSRLSRSSFALATDESNSTTAASTGGKSVGLEDNSLVKTAEYQDLITDQRIKDLFADPEVQQLIKDKDYMKLLQNKNFGMILDDPQLIAKILQMQNKINQR